MTISSGIWCFTAIHSAGVVHQVAVGLEIDDQPAAAFVRERDSKRGPDLRSGTKLAPGVAVGAIEVPQLSRPLWQCPGGEQPVFVFDRLPHLEREAGDGHPHLVSVL